MIAVPVFYSLLLYTSDNPEKLQYFSDAFTKRLNTIQNAHFEEDRKIETQFFVDIIKNKDNQKFEKKISSATERIKKKISEGKFNEAKEFATSDLKHFEAILLQNPHSLSQSLLTEFYFWNTIACIQDTHAAQERLSSFLSMATLAQRNALESELTPDIYKKFSQLVNAQKSIGTKTYTVQNKNNCSIFLNAQPLDQNSFSQFTTQKSVLNALCEKGIYSQIVSAESSSVITITPSLEKSFNSMPPLKDFPIQSIENKKINALIFIYWSERNKYLQTIVINPEDFSKKRELVLKLATKEDLRNAGDKNAQFIVTSLTSLSLPSLG